MLEEWNNLKTKWFSLDVSRISMKPFEFLHRRNVEVSRKCKGVRIFCCYVDDRIHPDESVDVKQLLYKYPEIEPILSSMIRVANEVVSRCSKELKQVER